MQLFTVNTCDINGRIIYLIDYLNITRYKFARKTGVSESTLMNISKNKNKPSFDVIERILNTFPEINANWLLCGRGEMFISEEEKEYLVTSMKQEKEKRTPSHAQSDNELFMTILREKDARIEELNRLVGKLEQKLNG